MIEIPIADIVIDPENANIHTEDNLISRKKSIQSIGLQYPIKVVQNVLSVSTELSELVVETDKKNEKSYLIVDGESRFIACKELGWNKIPCEILNINPHDKEEIARYSFALNKEREMYPFAECRHVARLYRTKREKDPRKTTALREEIGKEFGYEETTLRNMIAIGEISISPNGEMETFGIDVLKSLLPLRIGHRNPNTSEDENDYTLIHKCIEWLHNNKRILPTVADVSEFKDLVSDEMKELVVKHKAVIQAQKELEKEREKHESRLQRLRVELETTLKQSHSLEIAQKESEIKHLQLQLESRSSNEEQINNAITQLQTEHENLLKSIDAEIVSRLDAKRSVWEREKENELHQRLNTAEDEYRRKMNGLEIIISQKDLEIERLQEELELKNVEIKEKEKQLRKTQSVLAIKKYVDEAVIYHGMLEEIGEQFQDNSIDLILTDPPYGKEYSGCWETLTEFAARTLKPNCFLVTYSGQFYLPQVLSTLSKKLTYYWTIMVYHSGNAQLINAKNLFCKWKPILIFSKGETKLDDNHRLDDVIKGSGREKDFHQWQQGLSELFPLIRSFSDENDLIIDPFAGSGTTLLASLMCQRQAKGIEKEQDNIGAFLRRKKELSILELSETIID